MGVNARLKRSLGSDIVDRISELAISDTYSALIELLANSYDADASRVNLAYDGTMSVSDDGDGMTPKDLESFYRLGDSPKRAETVSPKGRTRIGKYGVATILLKYLTREYTLVTQKGGIESVVHEKFEGRLSPAKEIPFKTKRVDKKLHGTTISLSGLNFDVREDDFELSELINRIQWELPLLPDFTVYVNGEQVKSKSIENAVEFRIDEQRERMGRVHGSFYFCRRPTPMAGIHVYVNGRRVGDPKTFLGNSEKLRAGQQTRVVAVLHADDLEKAILFNRRMFKEDDAGYKKLRQLASKALYKIRNYVESHSVSNRGQYIENRMSVLIDKIRKRLVSGGVREITAETQFKFSTDIKRMFPGKYEQAANIFYFNKDFPSLSVEMYRTAQQYELALLNAVVDTLAYRRAHRKQKKSIDTLVAERHGIWHELGNTRGSETTPDKIHPMRVYTLAELARFSDRSIGALRNLVQSGLLQHIDDKVVGSSFIEVERKTNGMIPLFDFFEQNYGKYTHRLYKSFKKILSAAGKSAEPFVKDFGNGKPCYYVEQSCIRELEEFFSSGAFDMRKRTGPAQTFDEFGSQHFGLLSMASKFEGFDVKMVSKVLDYAKHKKLNIRKSGELKPRFHFGDFVAALQKMRG